MTSTQQYIQYLEQDQRCKEVQVGGEIRTLGKEKIKMQRIAKETGRQM